MTNEYTYQVSWCFNWVETEIVCGGGKLRGGVKSTKRKLFRIRNHVEEAKN